MRFLVFIFGFKLKKELRINDPHYFVEDGIHLKFLNNYVHHLVF